MIVHQMWSEHARIKLKENRFNFIRVAMPGAKSQPQYNTKISYESLDNDWALAKQYSDNPYCDLEASRTRIQEAAENNTPDSARELHRLGRAWVPPTAILPSTQAAVHAENCQYCNGIPSKTFPKGLVRRLYPTDQDGYDSTLDMIKIFRTAANLEPVKNEINPWTGVPIHSRSVLTDRDNRILN